jgi:hypothetical protein
MRSFLSIVAAPALCLGVLGGVAWENSRHAKPQDAEPFHAAARAAVDGWPTAAGDWVGRDVPLTQGAIQLLKPNAHFCRQYYNTRERNRRPVSLLVVQCRDPIDMSGHYPPNCYPNNGQPLATQKERTWTVPGAGRPVRGVEYHFASGSMLRSTRTVVYNFFVLPGRGVVPDMTEVREGERGLPAAALRVGPDPGGVRGEPGRRRPEWRDRVFATLIGCHPGVLDALNPGGI